MLFKLISQTFQNAKSHYDDGLTDFFLEEDKWDDFGYHTLYHIHACRKLTDSKPEYLGSINIMREGQKEKELHLIRNDIGDSFNSLPDNYCSISFSVELYRGIYRLLKTPDEKREFATALKMIFSKRDSRYKRFREEDCFKTSLMRNATMEAYAIQLGREIIYDKTTTYDLANYPLTYTLPNSKTEVRFDFSSANSELSKSIDIPSRLLACIGNNGAGKSTILYRLARILYATPSARDGYASVLGSIKPKDAGFRRLFLISYSAFDNFQLPGVGADDYELILQGLENRNGRLVYCGIRDIRSEYEEQIRKIKNRQEAETVASFTGKPEAQIKDFQEDIDHSHSHMLKTIDDLANEFYSALSGISQSKDKIAMWERLMDECSRANDSIPRFDLTLEFVLMQSHSEIIKGFKGLSTGIKYLLHSLSTILDRIEYNSIIIFDEPENHIQPPLLCKFLYCLRIISQQYSSLVLVATHSPVILQETLSKNVIVVSRNGDEWGFRTPSIETYGENIGSITNEVFNLNTSVTNYNKTAEQLFDKYPPHRKECDEPLRYLTRIGRETGLDFGNEIQSYLISKVLDTTL